MPQHWRPSGFKPASHIITLSVHLHEDGNYSACLTSYVPGVGIKKYHSLGEAPQDPTLAPPAFTALIASAQRALDDWWSGELS